MKDECAICSRTLPLYALKQCHICKKLYCRSCMTTNLWSEQRDLICLNCARRIVAPKSSGSKYGPLREYLWRRGQFMNLVTLTFPRIEGIIKSVLPTGAQRSEEWWNNNDTTAQGHAWTNAGWKVTSIDLKERWVTFKKQTTAGMFQTSGRRRRRAKTSQKPFTPVPVKPYRIRTPSKTHIARVLARAKNIERRRAEAAYGVRSKPKSVYEKKLYKQETNPKP